MHPMCSASTVMLLVPLLSSACAFRSDHQTLASLHRVAPDTAEVQIENGLEQAISGYRKFLDDAPESALTPEAMRRLADLKLDKEFGILGGEEAAAEVRAGR